MCRRVASNHPARYAGQRCQCAATGRLSVKVAGAAEGALSEGPDDSDYPGRVQDANHARRWLTEFFEWYAKRHRHSGLALFTPADVFFGRVAGLAATRQLALDAAYVAHPERFVCGRPVVRLPPSRVVIDLIDPGASKQTAADVLIAGTSMKAATKVALPQPPEVALPGLLHTGANVHAVCSQIA